MKMEKNTIPKRKKINSKKNLSKIKKKPPEKIYLRIEQLILSILVIYFLISLGFVVAAMARIVLKENFYSGAIAGGFFGSIFSQTILALGKIWDKTDRYPSTHYYLLITILLVGWLFSWFLLNCIL